jgi:hypothetical protein
MLGGLILTFSVGIFAVTRFVPGDRASIPALQAVGQQARAF